jgi:alpha-tubulin suppressor-like RCC1 family protein
MKSRAAWLLLVGASLAAAGCTDIPFSCTLDMQCRRGNEEGHCEDDTHRCSFADDSCPGSNRRYAPIGPEECVPPPPACSLAGVAAGTNFACAWSNLGRVTCWGEGGSGQLGDGTGNTRSTPKKIDGLSGVVQVIAGANHACARHRDGTISCWGDNTYQQVGDGGMPNGRSTPVKLPMLSQIKTLAAGGRQTCAVRMDGALFCWGRNDHGQVGDGTLMARATPTRVLALGNDATDVTAGDMHTCAMFGIGGVACWGWNRYGNVGPGLEIANIPNPVRLNLPFTATQVSTGDNHTCAVTMTDGHVQCWGLNDLGQVNRALPRTVDPTAVTVPPVADISAGGNHTCALLRDNTAACWGADSAGELGPMPADGLALPRADASWRQIASGGRHTCGLTANGEVLCWGRTSEGQLGDARQLLWDHPETTVKLPAGVGATQIAAGSTHTCMLGSDRRVYCWGRGESGQLGNGGLDSSSDAVAVELPGPAKQVGTGTDFSCALLVDGSVQCWGRGIRLGNANRMQADSSKAVAVAMATDDPTMTALAVGTDHACALSTMSAIYCWGETSQGRLGNGATAAGTAYRPVKTVIPNVDIAQLAAGGGHTCVLSKEGAVFCWGQSTAGQTGAGPSATPALMPVMVTPLPAIDSIALGANHTCARTKDGAAFCWGSGDQGQLGSNVTTSGIAQPVMVAMVRDFVSLTAGASHTCGVRASGVTMCWGYNRYGQLGNAMSPANKGTPVMTVFTPATVVVDVMDAGDRHTCAIGKTDRKVYCWGSNQHGQLGNGMDLQRPQPMKIALEMGGGCP